MLFNNTYSEQVVRALKKAGFTIVVTKPKHIGMSDGIRRLVIPNTKTLNPFTINAIIQDAGLSDEQFMRLISQ
ncbi:YcfA-like protein [Candidatus Magnetoovum chiemensis]|nr:YcfA-like protein [Candidatus Magnetoovum chiemensis]